MKSFANTIKTNRRWIIAAFVHWYLLTILQIDRCFFIYSNENKALITSKILALLLLEFIWITIAHVYKKWKQEDKFIRHYVHIWSLYTFFLCLLLLILWPGTWSWDDLWILNQAQYYHFLPWQHILSSYEQIVLLQLFPTPGGYVLIKNLLIAGIVAYVVCKLEPVLGIQSVIHNHYWIDILIKLIPFMLPPVLMYQFSGYRIGLYVYLELVMFTVIFVSLKGSFEWTSFRVCVFSVLIGVCACWRTESFMYFFLGMLFFAFSKNSSLTKHLRIMGTTFVILTCGTLFMCQSHALGNNNYELMSTIRPAVELIRHADPSEDATALASIHKVLDVNIVKAHPNHNGEFVYWNDKAVKKYTKAEYKAYLKSFVALSIKYPSIVTNERFNLFKDTSGLTKNGPVNNVDNSTKIFDSKNNWSHRAFSSIKTPFKYSAFPKIRSKLIKFMGMEKKGKAIQPFHAMEWNIVIPMLALVLIWGRYLVSKKWTLAILSSFLIVKIPIIFLTAPSSWFMYYLSFYLSGYLVIVYCILHKINIKKVEKL